MIPPDGTYVILVLVKDGLKPEHRKMQVLFKGAKPFLMMGSVGDAESLLPLDITRIGDCPITRVPYCYAGTINLDPSQN